MTTLAPYSSARARAGSSAVKTLMTNVELGAPEAGLVDDGHDPLGRLVAEHADGEGLGRQPPGDVAGRLGGDLPLRGGEDEADRVGVHGHRQQGVLLAGDPTDLHEHAGDRTATDPPNR
jgi:hypothetical protein